MGLSDSLFATAVLSAGNVGIFTVITEFSKAIFFIITTLKHVEASFIVPTDCCRMAINLTRVFENLDHFLVFLVAFPVSPKRRVPNCVT